ncbi:hypothetical protein CKO27_15515 [Thiocystis violacea]|nr:hypothetical protein [Thiocystis violacea]
MARLCLAGLVATTLAACNPVKKDQMTDSLQNATNGYQTALRWGYYENAYAFIDPRQRQDKPMPASLEGLRLTGYDVIQPLVLKQDENQAAQIVEIEYLYEDRQIVKKLKDRQVWRYDLEKKKWWLESGLPPFAKR